MMSTKTSAEEKPSGSLETAPMGTEAKPSINLPLWKKTCFAIVTCCLILVTTELLLLAMGVNRLRDNFDVTFGMSPHEPLFEERDQYYRVRQNKLAFFQEQQFPKAKADETKRVFCLGGSTTFGRPYSDRESYNGILRSCLQTTNESNWEFINCGGVSYASYRLAVLADELAQYSPDLFIVYTGHNEFLEERTFGDIKNRWQSSNLFLQMISNSRIASFFDYSRKSEGKPKQDPLLEKEVSTILEGSVGPAAYKRDATLAKNIVAQYRQSLRQIHESATKVGAKIIFVIPADNIEFSPFKSEHGEIDSETKEQIDRKLASYGDRETSDLTIEDIEILQRLVQLDPLYAESHYHLGRANKSVGRFEEAYTCFVAARENCVCPLRANEAIRQELRDFAEANNLPLVDFPSLMESYCVSKFGNRIPGKNVFFDHVHPRTEVHGLLARHLCFKLNEIGMLSDNDLQPCLDSLEPTMISLKKSLNPVDHAKALSNLAQVLSWSGKIREGLELAKEADSIAPDDVWIKCQYGRLVEKNGDLDGAEFIYAEAVDINSNHSLATFRLGTVKLRRKEYSEAFALARHSHSTLPPQAPLSFKRDVERLLAMSRQGLQSQPPKP